MLLWGRNVGWRCLRIAWWGEYLCLLGMRYRPLGSRGLRRGSEAARLLGLWVRIPPGACLSLVSVVCCQVEVSVSGWSLVQRSPTECDRESSTMRRPWSPGGCCAKVKHEGWGNREVDKNYITRSLVICTPHQILFRWWNRVKWNERARSTHGGEVMCIQGFGGKTWGKETTPKTPGVDRRVILRWIFRTWDGADGLDLYGSGHGHVAGTCERGNEPSGSIKCREFRE